MLLTFFLNIRDDSLSGTELTSKLEPAFLAGLRCNQPPIRQKFVEVRDISCLYRNIRSFIIIYPLPLPLKKKRMFGGGGILVNHYIPYFTPPKENKKLGGRGLYFFTAFYAQPNFGEYVLYMCYAQDFAVSYVYRNIC